MHLGMKKLVLVNIKPEQWRFSLFFFFFFFFFFLDQHM